MKRKLIRFLSLALLAFTLSVATMPTLQAQCPMCRITAESNMKNGGTAGNGLNTGILYMLAAPYLLVGGIAFIWWKNRRKEIEN